MTKQKTNVKKIEEPILVEYMDELLKEYGVKGVLKMFEEELKMEEELN